MPKIMLVEDDNNLREIYGERLMAEGYEIVSAADGEQALSLAVKEKPDLVISDVMMPKISGFDMLDILRQTPETQDIRVVMMTALSQTEDKERAEKLGIDKYLVKSQVTLEDVARVVHDILYPAPLSQNNDEPTVISNQPVVEEVTVVEEPVADQQPDHIDPAAAQTPVATPTSVDTIQTINDTSSTGTDSSDSQPVVSSADDASQAVVADEDLVDLNNIVNQALSDQPENSEPELVASQTIITPDTPAIESTNNDQIIEVVPESDITIEYPHNSSLEDEGAVAVEEFSLPDLSVKQPDLPAQEEPNMVENSEPQTTEVIEETVVEEPIPAMPNLEIIDPEQAKPESTEQEEAEVNKQINDFVNNTPEADLDNKQQKPYIEPSDEANQPPQQDTTEADPSTIPPISAHNSDSSSQSGSSVPEAPSARKKVIAPIHDPSEAKPDINKLFEKEMAQEASNTAIENPNLSHPYSEAPSVVTSQPLQTVDVNQIDGATTATEPQFDNNAVPVPAPEEEPTDSLPNNPNDPTHIAL